MRKLFCALVSVLCLVSAPKAYALEVGPGVVSSQALQASQTQTLDGSTSGAIQLSYEVVDTENPTSSGRWVYPPASTVTSAKRGVLGSFAEIQTGDLISPLMPLSLVTLGMIFVTAGMVSRDTHRER